MPSSETKELLLNFQRNEITEYHVYHYLARRARGKNREVLEHIAHDEQEHYKILHKHTGVETGPEQWRVWRYRLLSRLFGLTFTIKLMEKGESFAQAAYERVHPDVPDLNRLLQDEHKHEQDLIAMIQEERLDYMDSIVLGLNDALVELTGALAGLSFALQNTNVIAMSGLVTGIAASLSMAASEYLSKKSEGDTEPLKASTYTGIAYIVTVLLLVLPFLVLSAWQAALPVTLIIGLGVIATFTYFNAIVHEKKFRRDFLEMAALSFGVAIISFGVGLLLRQVFGVEV